ncbi:MAG: YidC/Oxa1 family membrane protein insertase [Acidimicrobiales bacterium]
MYELIAWPLQVFYQIWPNYAIAISMVTLLIMIILLPLTLKGTRSMLALQKLQPELRKIQAKYKDDRQKLNEEMMAFYKENNINPLGGCLPLLIQMPVFIFLYRTLFQLITKAPYGQDMGSATARATTGVNDGIYTQFGYFHPKHLDTSSKLYQDLSHTREMVSFGINLAESAREALKHGVGYAFPYIVMVLIVTATSYIQQKQVSGRTPQSQVNQQQQMLMRIMPLFFAFISFTLPAGIVLYFLVSNLFRVGQQALITRTLYKDDDKKVVSTSGRESDKSSTKGKGTEAAPKGFLAQLKEIGLPNPAEAKREVQASKAKQGSDAGASKGGGTKTATKSSSGSSSGASSGAKAPSRTAPSAANRSKSKKKRK